MLNKRILFSILKTTLIFFGFFSSFLLVSCNQKDLIDSSPMFKPKKISKHTITSELDIYLACKREWGWGYLGILPGEVDVPVCLDIQFSLPGLDKSNVLIYKAEIQRLNMKNITLPGSVTEEILAEFITMGMLDDVEQLSLIHCDSISDLSSLAKLTNLKKLSLPVEYFDYKSLAKIPGLQIVTVWNCWNLKPFKKMKSLKGLHLVSCDALSNLSPLVKMTGIEELWLHDCSTISDFSPLTKMVNLRNLSIKGNSFLTDTSVLSNISGLEEISLQCNLSDISSLSEMSGLKKITLINCYDIPQESIDELKIKLPDCDVVVIMTP